MVAGSIFVGSMFDGSIIDAPARFADLPLALLTLS
jgi:hypothetical protein